MDTENQPAPDEQPITNVQNTAPPEIPSTPVSGVTPAAVPAKRRFWSRLSGIEKLLPPFLRRKLGKFAPLFAAVCLILVITAGGAAAWWATSKSEQPVEHFSIKAEPFSVESSVPDNEAVSVSPDSSITIKFNRPVDPSNAGGNFFVAPEVAGRYSAGETDREITFTPEQPFFEGTIVQLMIHGEFQSLDGSDLGVDYFTSFTTTIPANAVRFERQGYLEELSSMPANEKRTYTLSAGEGVSTEGDLTLYKSSMSALLDSYIYKDVEADDYTYQTFVNESVPTGKMQKISSQKGTQSGATIDIQQDSGIYVLVASEGDKQFGHLWIVASDFGALVKQDDKKVVLAAQKFSDQSPLTVDVTLYSLKDRVRALKNASVDGLGTLDQGFDPKVDVVVAEAGGNVVIVPLAIVNSLADQRMERDLSATNTVYGLSDKPTYSVGETIRLAGFVREDNDAVYTIPNDNSVEAYIAESAYSKHLKDFPLALDNNGSYTTEFKAADDFITEGQSSTLLHLYVKNHTELYFDAEVGSFTVTTQKPSEYNLQVTFDKPEFIASDPVTAHITGTNADGSVLGDTPVSVKIYSKEYSEHGGHYNIESYDTIGGEVNDDPITVTLNSKGKADVPVDLSKLEAGSSRTITVQANNKDGNGVSAAGGASAVVHQGDGSIEFGATKTVVKSGEELASRVTATKLDGSPMANTTIDYKLIKNRYENDTWSAEELSSGNVTADGNGYAEIKIKLGEHSHEDNLEIHVWVQDNFKNKILANMYYYIQDPQNSIVYSELQLAGLDIAGDTETEVGETLNLTVNSPQDIKALVTYERGRIHHQEIVDLKQGANSYAIDVTAELAPSFTLVFSYFVDGVYKVDGLPIDVHAHEKEADVQLSTDMASYKPDTKASVTIKAIDHDGKPIQTNMIVEVIDENAFNLYDKANLSMVDALYSSREITTNSSSSLTGMGSGGGGCGGDGGGAPELTNPNGRVVYWNPSVTTDANGEVKVNVKLPKGNWRIYAYSMNGQSVVDESFITVTAQ